MLNLDKVLKDHEALMHGHTYNYSKKYALDYDEAKSVYYEHAVRALLRYDATVGASVTTVIHNTSMVLNNLGKKVMKERQRNVEFDETYIAPAEVSTEDHFDVSESDIGTDGRLMLTYIESGITDTGNLSTPTSVASYCKTLGWSGSRIKNARQELAKHFAYLQKSVA